MGSYINPEEANWLVTQGFGMFPGGYNPVGGHTGRDKGMPIGRPLRAPGDGVITLAGNAGPWNTNEYWLNGEFAGQSVVLETDDGEWAFTLNHLSKVLVKVGQKVKKGDIICISGNSGSATTGSHHHFEAMPNGWNFQNGTYGRVNPDTVCKGFWSGGIAQVTAPNQRLNGPQVTNQRSEPKVTAKVVREIPANQLEIWEGFVHGQSVTSGKFTSDIWYKDKVGYSWCGGFTSQSTAGLPDLTPRKTLAANQRLAGPAGVTQRKKADTSSAVVRSIAGNSVEVFTGFVRGQKLTIGSLTSDIWYVDAKGFAWAGGFTSQSIVGLPDLTVVAPPVSVPAPAPVAPAPTEAFLNGIDVAVYQEAASLNTIEADFYWIKASEGGGEWSDKALASNVAEARLTGKPIGFYHFARPLATPENTATAEAASFLAVIKPHLQVGDLVALDWESENQHRTDWAEEWLDTVAAALRCIPFIYMSASTINKGDWSKVEIKYPLWLASYGANPVLQGYHPRSKPTGVTWAAGFLMYQYSSKTRLANYDGDLDVNVFYDTESVLRTFGAKRTMVAQPAPNPPIVPPAPPVNLDASVLARFFSWLTDMFLKSGR
jgi:GH25 family lysozyme M1 (1,4-beta-N-acetylmuramidase)